MTTIEIIVTNKIAVCASRYVISANSDYCLKFNFDSQWNSVKVKTARILFDNKAYEVVFTGDAIVLPKIPPCKNLCVGVYSDTLATTAAEIGCVISAADLNSETTIEFTESRYDQIIKMLSDLDLRQISGIEKHGETVTVNFNDGSSNTFTVKDGTGVKSAAVTDENELRLTLTDETVVSCGKIIPQKEKWILLGTKTAGEDTDEVTISADTSGKAISTGELYLSAVFSKTSQTTEPTDVYIKDANLPKSASNAQAVFEKALTATADKKRSCYLKAVGAGGILSVKNAESGTNNSDVLLIDTGTDIGGRLSGVTLFAAAKSGKIGAGSTFTLYGKA